MIQGEFGDTEDETRRLMDRLAAVYIRDHRWTKAKPLFGALWKQYYPIAQQDPILRRRALDFLFSYVTTSEAAGSPLNSLQEMFAIGEHAHARDDAVGEIRLWAAQGGFENLFRIFLEEWADLDIKESYDGLTALHIAAADGQETIVQLLLEKGADVMARSKHGETALHWAAIRGHKEVVQLLLEKGA